MREKEAVKRLLKWQAVLLGSISQWKLGQIMLQWKQLTDGKKD